MTFSTGQIESLQAPLNRSAVKSREQAGRKLSYIEGWHAIDEANRIFGHDAWDRETFFEQETSRDLVELTNSKGSYKQWRVSYIAKVRITVYAGNDRVIRREGTGYGSGMAKPEALGDAIESAIKEAETDAMKRALMTFGNPFGLALYDKEQTNVVTDQPAEPAKAQPRPPARNDNPFDDFPGDMPSKKEFKPAVSSSAISLGREVIQCKSILDINRLKKQPEFIQFWKEANGEDRKHITDIANKRKAELEAIMDAPILQAGE